MLHSPSNQSNLSDQKPYSDDIDPEMRQLATSYLEIEQCCSGKKAYKKVVNMTQDQIFSCIHNVKGLVTYFMKWVSNTNNCIKFMKKFKKRQPKRFNKIMDMIKQEDPNHYISLMKLQKH